MKRRRPTTGPLAVRWYAPPGSRVTRAYNSVYAIDHDGTILSVYDKLHLVPSGILHARARCVVGNGVVIHLPGLFEELATLAGQGVAVGGRLTISDRAHLLFDLHKGVDGAREAELAGGKIGTTGRGIGPAYASKATRNGLRVGDLRDFPSFEAKLRSLAADAKARFPDLAYDVDADVEAYKEYAARTLPLVGDTVSIINDAVDAGDAVDGP